MIYRLDLATGKQTRRRRHRLRRRHRPIDPRSCPLLYTGQGLNDMDGTECPWQYRIFDLIPSKQVAG